MKALMYYGPGELRLDDMPVPSLSDGEILVKVRAVGVCATDVKTYKHGHPKIKEGSVIGHEIAGTIVDMKHVEGWAVGERVAVAPYTPCLECRYCLQGQYTLCDHLMDQSVDPGGFAEYVRVPAKIVSQGLVKLPDGLPFQLAALTEPLACCIHGLEAIDPQPDDVLLIIGDGTMGLMQGAVARHYGVRQIVISGMIPERLAVAKTITDHVVDAGHEDLAERLAQISPRGADKIMVSVGDTKVAEAALKYAAKGAVINLYAGLPKGQSILFDPNRIHYDGIQLLGTFGFAPQHFHKAVDLIGPNQELLETMLTGSVALNATTSAISAMSEYRGIKYVVDMPAAGEEVAV